MILTVPAQLEKTLWTLGPQVCDWIEGNLPFGPGDLRGEPAVIDDEKRWFIYRFYEVFPRRHAQAGRRQHGRCVLSERKGTAKTELAAWIAAAELDPTAPVRCIGFDRRGGPIGGPVKDPYIPMVAYTEEQSEDLAYGALLFILENSRVAGHFDLGLERIMRVGGDGKAVALAAAPDSRDGARTTFQHFDETHRFTTPRLKQAHKTMMANLPKRRLADAWSLETTTAPAPGEGSIAEQAIDYAKMVVAGKADGSRFFFFHRQASDGHDMTTLKGIRAAVLEASGPGWQRTNVEAIVDQFRDPNADRAYLERVWTNRLVRASHLAFDAEAWKKRGQPGVEIPAGELVALGFDGARYVDAAALVATGIKTGLQQLVGLWEKPFHLEQSDEWEVPEAEVHEAVDAAFTRWQVRLFYADPPYWETPVATWQGDHGDDVVVAWPTNRWGKIAFACRAYANAILTGELTHDGNADLGRHVGNAHRRQLSSRDDKGQPLWVIQKERPDSPLKIDAAMAGILSWEARRDALSDGAAHDDEPSVYETRGLAEI